MRGVIIQLPLYWQQTDFARGACAFRAMIHDKNTCIRAAQGLHTGGRRDTMGTAFTKEASMYSELQQIIDSSRRIVFFGGAAGSTEICA